MMSFNRKFSEKNDYNIITLPLHSQFQLLTNLFYNWLESKGKLGGQNKMPKLVNGRQVIDLLLDEN